MVSFQSDFCVEGRYLKATASGNLLDFPLSPDEVWFNAFVAENDRENRDRNAAFLRDAEATEIAEFKRARRDVTALVGWLHPNLPDLSKKRDAAAYGRLKVTAYVHNRITLTASQGGRRVVGDRLKTRDLKSLVKQSGILDICRESRQGFKIGGRWRNLPLKTDFTPRARNFIRDAGYIIETSSNVTPWFLTLTIPGEGKLINDVLSAGSGYIIDRFNRWMRYRIESGYFAYVWEVQERGTPHVHYMFRANLGDSPGVFLAEVRAEWRKILLDVSADTGVDVFENADGYSWKDDPEKPLIDLRQIETSVAGYLAKYASKTQSKANAASGWHPGRWWGVSYPLRREVLRRRLQVVLGLETLDDATRSIKTVCDKLGPLIQSAFIPESDNGFVDYFVSLVTVPGMSKKIARAICMFLVDGDETALQFLRDAVSSIREGANTEDKESDSS